MRRDEAHRSRLMTVDINPVNDLTHRATPVPRCSKMHHVAAAIGTLAPLSADPPRVVAPTPPDLLCLVPSLAPWTFCRQVSSSPWLFPPTANCHLKRGPTILGNTTQLTHSLACRHTFHGTYISRRPPLGWSLTVPPSPASRLTSTRPTGCTPSLLYRDILRLLCFQELIEHQNHRQRDHSLTLPLALQTKQGLTPIRQCRWLSSPAFTDFPLTQTKHLPLVLVNSLVCVLGCFTPS